MVKYGIQKIRPNIITSMTKNTLGKGLNRNMYGHYSMYFKQDGKAFVPIQPTASILSRTRNSRFKGGEKKLEDWEIFNKALLAEPMVFRSVMLLAKFIVAYGYNFGYIRKYKKSLTRQEKDRLEFMEDWAEYIGLSQKIFQIAACMTIYGNAFIEKVYDNKTYPRGWGVINLKLIHPLSMFVDRELTGAVRDYWQRPPNFHGRDVKKLKEAGGMKLKKNTIMHFKWNDYANLTYGTSDIKPLIDTISMKVGMREDAAIMVQQRATPIIAWLVGDVDHPVPSDFLSAAAGYIESNADGSNDLVLPGFMKPEVISTGKDMPNINEYLGMFSSEIVKGIGVPEVLLGEGNDTTEATAKIQLESFFGETQFRQNKIGDKFRRELFVDIFMPPKRRRKDRLGSVSNDYISPREWKNIPSQIFNPILSAPERVEMAIKTFEAGLRSREESRTMIGETTDIGFEDLHPDLRVKEKEIENFDREFELKKKENEIKEKVADKPVPTPFGGSGSPAKKAPVKKAPAKKVKQDNTSFP